MNVDPLKDDAISEVLYVKDNIKAVLLSVLKINYEPNEKIDVLNETYGAEILKIENELFEAISILDSLEKSILEIK